MKGFAALAAALVAVASPLTMASPACATFAGENGRIAFQRVFFRSDGSPARIPIFTIRSNGVGAPKTPHVLDPGEPFAPVEGLPDWGTRQR
jgi:hypothetical protein